MLTELHGKGGQVCQSAKEGKIRCPLIVRPTSEDVVTGHLVNSLRILNPRWWLPDLLNTALGVRRFHRRVFRSLQIKPWQIKPWQNHPCYPRELLPWDEGSTQVDTVISWENPPTTVYLELKYGSELGKGTAGNNGSQEYPGDQLIRNLRVGLWQNGWLRLPGLFPVPPRDFVLILVSPKRGNPLVNRYRDVEKMKAAIPRGEFLGGNPHAPFLGELSYTDIVRVLLQQRRWFSRPERILLDGLVEYLQFKRVRIEAGRQRSDTNGLQETFDGFHSSESKHL